MLHVSLLEGNRYGNPCSFGVSTFFSHTEEGFFPEERGVFDRSNKQKARGNRGAMIDGGLGNMGIPLLVSGL